MGGKSEPEAAELKRKLEEFFRGADLSVHDTQYTATEYDNGKRGWGHSTIEYVIEFAARAGFKTLEMFHYDPTRTDSALD